MRANLLDYLLRKIDFVSWAGLGDPFGRPKQKHVERRKGESSAKNRISITCESESQRCDEENKTWSWGPGYTGRLHPCRWCPGRPLAAHWKPHNRTDSCQLRTDQSTPPELVVFSVTLHRYERANDQHALSVLRRSARKSTDVPPNQPPHPDAADNPLWWFSPLFLSLLLLFPSIILFFFFFFFFPFARSLIRCTLFWIIVLLLGGTILGKVC